MGYRHEFMKWVRREAEIEADRKHIGYDKKMEYRWEKTIKGPLQYTVEYFRDIRGDLIEIYYKNEKVIDYVDQSKAYGFIGVGDFEGIDFHISTLNNWVKANRRANQ